MKKKKPKEKGVFFRKDEEGNHLFSPWGDTGESFYVSRKQQKYLRIFSHSLSIVFLMAVFGIIFLDIRGGQLLLATDYIFIILFILFIVAHISAIPVFIRGCKLCETKKINISKSTYRDCLIAFLCPLIFFMISLLDSHFSWASFLVGIINILYLIFITRFFIKLRKTKGYYFSEKFK